MKRRHDTATIPVLRWLPGEQEAVALVKALGAQYGYGNLIHHLHDAWAAAFREEGFSQHAADRAGGHICAWCSVDSRTGKKARRR